MNPSIQGTTFIILWPSLPSNSWGLKCGEFQSHFCKQKLETSDVLFWSLGFIYYKILSDDDLIRLFETMRWNNSCDINQPLPEFLSWRHIYPWETSHQSTKSHTNPAPERGKFYSFLFFPSSFFPSPLLQFPLLFRSSSSFSSSSPTAPPLLPYKILQFHWRKGVGFKAEGLEKFRFDLLSAHLGKEARITQVMGLVLTSRALVRSVELDSYFSSSLHVFLFLIGRKCEGLRWKGQGAWVDRCLMLGCRKWWFPVLSFWKPLLSLFYVRPQYDPLLC